jgi:glycerol-1-phosphate dehydrogenase [NAD(P)+]
MINTTFAVDPANMPAVKRWLAAQDDPREQLRSIDIDEILIGPGVLLDLPFVLQRAGVAPGSKVQLVVDETPIFREDVDLKRFVRDLLYVAGYDESTCHLEENEYALVHANFDHVEGVLWGLDPGAGPEPCTALIAIGSGTVTDIAKHAAYLYDQQHPDQPPIVYICIPTANSVTAYAANMAVLLKDGVKRTIPSRYPTAIIADLRILASAPKAMTLAGLGDCCARFVAYGDWYLASALGLVDIYSEVPLALLNNLDAILLETAPSIGQRTHKGEAILARALLLAGIAQSIVNMSAPISGTEHVTSHVLDMIAEHHHRRLALHGAQVGVATLSAARLYQQFLDTFDPKAVRFVTCYPEHEQEKLHIQQLFQHIDQSGAMAAECWQDFSKKLSQWQNSRDLFESFCQTWYSRHRDKLASLVCPPMVVQQILSSAGAPLLPQDLDPSISWQEYDFAVENGHFIRSRFVLSDLLYFLGA